MVAMFGLTSTVVTPSSLKALIAGLPEWSHSPASPILRAPLPRIRTFMDHFGELAEEVAAVHRAGRRLGMEPHGHERLGARTPSIEPSLALVNHPSQPDGRVLSSTA